MLNYHYSDKDNKPYVYNSDPMPNTRVVMEILAFWVVDYVCGAELYGNIYDLIMKADGQEEFDCWAKSKLGIYIKQPIKCDFGWVL